MSSPQNTTRSLAAVAALLVIGAAAPCASAQGQPDSVVAWGANNFGQCNVPPPNMDFVAVAAGFHSLGLKSDGSIVAWGDNSVGQCNVPAPNADFVAIGAGDGHSLGVKADGSVVAWGLNAHGQCNVPLPNTGFVGVAGGAAHSVGVKADGSVRGWGYCTQGNCPNTSPNSGFVAVSAGFYHSMGLRDNGSIVVWGHCGGGGACGLGVPAPNTGFVAIGSGTYHCVGVKTDGSIVAWGLNTNGQCNVPQPNTGFVAVDGGRRHTLGLKADGSIVAWGLNTSGQCIVPLPNTGFIAVSGGTGDSGGSHSLGLNSGTLGGPYCTANPNSTGVAARITATGSTELALNSVTLNASQLPLNSFGYFLTSLDRGFIVGPGGNQGNLCLSGAIGRYVGPGQIRNSGTVGAVSLVLNVNAMPTPGGLVPAQAGESWHFTYWYRDANPTTTSNLTNGVSVTFQ